MTTPGVKYDAGKPRMDLFPTAPLLTIGQVYAMGAQKYADRNWEKGLDWGRVYAALQRHALAFWGGEDVDPESGLPHMAHVAWNALTLLEFMNTHPELDSRAHVKRGSADPKDGPHAQARDDVPPKRRKTPAAAPRSAPGEDEQPLPGRDSGLVVLGPLRRSLDRIQVPSADPGESADPARPDSQAEGLARPATDGGPDGGSDRREPEWRRRVHTGRLGKVPGL